ncbi:hypothetical protein SAMN05660649_03132 [Desulfotomaculum arcticum]|uniref:Uncharacterized protein n=1 Tax=Desulfotruncus arcticus DSM 17038 TaxID=1121424 RepID=A0A1I2VS92_9FIRM|nr:hypothetical protein [Desulfotruncus arcticus]SFG92184.1 hypothetical protein SAMN05660649_03132 [Desulfotomaculum arcticum] [Desulfotruncus arcticus DSM 17038]
MENAIYACAMSELQGRKDNLEYYFVSTGFIDLLPLARELAGKLGLGKVEMIEAICKVADKYKIYPPTINRSAWFAKVYKEKLLEARADILTFNKCR